MYNILMTKKILITDDTSSWLKFHKELIEELYGNMFEVTTASSAFEALDIIKHNTENPFILILTDLQMETAYEPKLAGEWLIENIREIKEYKSVNIVIISAVYNIEQIAKSYGVECISKHLLIRNKLLMKFMLEKLMPFLNKI